MSAGVKFSSFKPENLQLTLCFEKRELEVGFCLCFPGLFFFFFSALFLSFWSSLSHFLPFVLGFFSQL